MPYNPNNQNFNMEWIKTIALILNKWNNVFIITYVRLFVQIYELAQSKPWKKC